MQGDHTLWLPGTDHASIATEVKIIEALAKEGLTKQDLGREGFLKRAWAWKKPSTAAASSGSCAAWAPPATGAASASPWTKAAPTAPCSEVFVRLYEKGLIYRGNRIINWCPECRTALSDAEVEYRGAGFPPLVHPLSRPRTAARA